jgi:hypothetical protein
VIGQVYANMCGVELWNQARFSAYMANGVKPPKSSLRCEPCAALVDLVPCLEDEPPLHDAPIADGYQLPDLDDAPWYDPLVPNSKDFAGLYVLQTVLSPAIDRRMVQNVGHGATLTRARYQGRTLYVRALAAGRTCCSVDYGLKWLTQALLGDPCEGCAGCELTFLTCSPSVLDESECLTVIEEGGARVPYLRADESSEMERGLDFARRMYGAALLQGPEVLGRRGGGCGCGCSSVVELEFTIGIGTPWMYGLEEAVTEGSLLGGCDPGECRLTFRDDLACDPLDPCTVPAPCADDPDCAEPSPPALTGGYPRSGCGCIPFVVGRNCLQIPGAQEWVDHALIIEVNAGSAAMRNLQIFAWQNPLGLDCCAEANEGYFDACSACASLIVGYVPAFGTLRFDSVSRLVTIECNELIKPAMRTVASVDGRPFEWFDLSCQDICLGFEVDCANIAADATVSVWRAGREL